MRRLTKAQRRVLGEIDDYGLHRHFDVWCGHYWKLGVNQIAGRTAEVLMESGMIELGDDVRTHSGHKSARAFLTEEGRAALAQQEKAGADG